MEIQDQVEIENLRIQGNPITDDYQILTTLYQGPLGEVRKIKSTFHNKVRVVKMVQRDLIEEDQEFRIMRNVGNIQNCQKEVQKGILKVYEFYQDENSNYMVQAIVEGPSLIDSILSNKNKQQYTESSVVDIIKQLLTSLLFGQENGITHGNMKLGSFYWNSEKIEDRHLLLVDYGISTTLPNQIQFEGDKPTPLPYLMAPEVIDGDQNYSEKCDVWSVGALAYLLLSGSFPFSEGQDISIFELIQAGEVDFVNDVWKDISAEAVDFIKQLLNLDNKQRISAAECLKHSWITQNKSKKQPLTQTLKNLHETIIKYQIKERNQDYFLMQNAIKKQKFSLLQKLKKYDNKQNKEISQENLVKCLKQQYNITKGEHLSEDILNSEINQYNYDDYVIQSYINEKKEEQLKHKEHLKEINSHIEKQSIDKNNLYFFENEIKKMVGGTVFQQLKVKIAQFQTAEGAVPFTKLQEILNNYIQKESQKDDISQRFDEVVYESQQECHCQCQMF